MSAPADRALLRDVDDALAAVVTAVRASLVRVEQRGPRQVGGSRARGHGAGTIWHPDGLVVTNAHVVGRGRGVVSAPRVVLNALDGRETAVKATVLAVDADRDLAALALPADRTWPTISLGQARALRPGDWVLALGHPWGVTGAVTAGAVIAVGPAPEGGLAGDLIQVGCQMRPGHSGGALVDVQGRLVGINTMIAGPHVGLAIPLYVVKRFLREHLGRGAGAIQRDGNIHPQ